MNSVDDLLSEQAQAHLSNMLDVVSATQEGMRGLAFIFVDKDDDKDIPSVHYLTQSTDTKVIAQLLIAYLVKSGCDPQALYQLAEFYKNQ